MGQVTGVMACCVTLLVAAPVSGRAATDSSTPAVQMAARGTERKLDKRVDIAVKDADVRSVLSFLGHHSRINVVMSSKIGGKVTLYLERVSVRAALTAVLKVNGLDMRIEDNVILVMTRQELADVRRREGHRR